MRCTACCSSALRSAAELLGGCCFFLLLYIWAVPVPGLWALSVSKWNVRMICHYILTVLLIPYWLWAGGVCLGWSLKNRDNSAKSETGFARLMKHVLHEWDRPWNSCKLTLVTTMVKSCCRVRSQRQCLAMLEGMVMSVCRSINHFCLDWNI